MSGAHTQGPWTHEGQGDITGIENDPENGCVGLVDVASVYLRTVPGRSEANANLIAAAPDLLAALKAFLEGALAVDSAGYIAYIDIEQAIAKAHAAISKATGQEGGAA